MQFAVCLSFVAGPFENEFYSHENELTDLMHFHNNGFAIRFETEVRRNSVMTFLFWFSMGERIEARRVCDGHE